ncbi:MAG: hypothetical protein ACYDH6_06190 [Acidimicrobiales bacterium]
MTTHSDLDAYLRGAIGLAGITVTDEELAMVRLFHDAVSPRIDALVASDVLAVPIEYDSDPSRAPRP